MRAMVILGATVLAGCALVRDTIDPRPTRYGPLEGRWGYADFPIPGEVSSYFVGFYANGRTQRIDVARYWYQRASELCEGKYEVLRSNLDAKTLVTSSAPMSSPVNCTGEGATRICSGGGSIGGGTDTIVRPFMEGVVRCLGAMPGR